VASPATVGLITIWYRAAAAIDSFGAELSAMRYPRLRPVFVVHDLPPDDVHRLRAAAPDALILEPGANLGPAAGWNLAIRELLGQGVDYISICNVGTHFDPNCLNRLVAVLRADASIGACQPLLCHANRHDVVQMFGGSLNTRTGVASHDYADAIVSESLPAMRDADYLDGGSMVIRADVLHAVGGFDERLFMYAEDCDLSLRIRQAGCRTVAVRDARAWHDHPEGPGQLPPAYEVFYRTRNRFLLVRKFGGRQAMWVLRVRGVLWEMPRGVAYYLRRGRSDLARAHVAGVLHGAAGRFGKRGWVA
jgi:N-acetylglucosaminyl-diphospho-decaprenol L-rhamnosyltransferase